LLPRSRTQPVPQHRTQVCCTTAAGRASQTQTRFPKSIGMAFVFVGFTRDSECDIIDAALRPRREIV
jgi:hypothetical protein